VSQQVSSLAEGSVLDDGSRMIVVSWMVEVAEEFGLQQETLHAAVSLLDRFLSTSNVSVVWVRVAVGCALGGWVGGWVGAQEFRLEQETLQAAVTLLDRSTPQAA
jgi:hypothetical protein